MTTPTRRRRPADRGFALATVLLVLVLASGIVAAVHSSLLSNTAASGAHHRATSAFYAAEAGINRGMGDYRNIFLNYSIPSGSDYDAHTFAIGHRNVTYQLGDVPGNPRQIIMPAGRPFPGLSATEYRYIASSKSQLTTGEVEASIGTQFNVDYVPLFQFLAFYQNDLEILPGANMNLHGPIHTNGRLYLNSDATLSVRELNPNIPSVHISAVGNIYRGRKDANTCAGTVTIAKLADANHDGVLDLGTLGCGSGTTAMSTTTLTGWLGALMANQPTVAVPTPDVLAHGTGEYWQKADLRIVLDVDEQDADGLVPIVVQQVDGSTDATATARLQAFMAARPGRIFYNDVPLPGADQTTACTSLNSYCNRRSYAPAFATASAVYPCADSSLGLYAGCAAHVGNETRADGSLTARRGGFYNNREHSWVRMLNVNVRDLLAWNRNAATSDQLFDPDDASEGGIVLFLTVVGPGSGGVGSPRYGARVFGSPNLDFAAAPDPTGLTVVSDQAVYVEGDYNSGAGACTFGTCPKAPAALMGDALNVLSNGWSGTAACVNDCQSRLGLSSRIATSTVLNAAVLAGVDETVPGVYNGGLENYPRFHEDWSGRTLVYRGSFVSLGTPRHNNGQWCGTGTTCGIYNAPMRNWDYDTDYQNVAMLPPITPRFVAVEQILFTENFR